VLKCLVKNKSVNCVAHYVIMNHEEPQKNEPASAGVRRSAPAEACVTQISISLTNLTNNKYVWLVTYLLTNLVGYFHNQVSK